MKTTNLLNTISAIQNLSAACDALLPDLSASHAEEMKVAAKRHIDNILHSSALSDGTVIGNSDTAAGDNCLSLGTCVLDSGCLTNRLSLPIAVDYSEPFTCLITVESRSDLDTASRLANHLLFQYIRKVKRGNYRCADMISGGRFFTQTYGLITNFKNRSGGAVILEQEKLSELMKWLTDQSQETLSSLGSYKSVRAYNEEHPKKLAEYLTVICQAENNDFYNNPADLKKLVLNSRLTGMSYIIVAFPGYAEHFRNLTDLPLTVRNGSVVLGDRDLFPITDLPDLTIPEDAVELLKKEMISRVAVRTEYECHPELHQPLFTMDATPVLRIPFSIDGFNQLQYFEIGGAAPSHALMAGSTGSGKSTALHTFIMMTISSYHPDDVEIWAIDYKAVEFNFYIQNPTPHFRVIAQDTSVEFSLSLIDRLYEEYEKRQRLFVDNNVKDIEAYRKKFGKRSMPRILVVIDEFQLMTQAVSEYTGDKDYRTELENLLRLTRAMGISFIFSSQTIASGLSGLSNAARDQIGCRLCLKHEDPDEVRETLMLSGPDSSDIVYKAKELRRGQGIYKRARLTGEHSPDGKGFEFLDSNILYLNDTIRKEKVDEICAALGNDYTPKEVIIVRGNDRIPVSEKERHPLQKFIAGEYEPNEDALEWYPAAPTSLDDYCQINIERISGANCLVVGENDDLRASILFHSVCGFLMNPDNRVIVNLIDETYSDRENAEKILSDIRCPRLIIRSGINDVFQSISELKKLRPQRRGTAVYLWYGLDKLKNEIFLAENEEEENEETSIAVPSPSPIKAETKITVDNRDDLLAAFTSDYGTTDNNDNIYSKINAVIADMKSSLDESNQPPQKAEKAAKADVASYDFDSCKKILATAFDMGPENGYIHMAVFNNRKTMQKSGLIPADAFENKIGMSMSIDDAFTLFGTSRAIKKANDTTVIYATGGEKFTPLRPYCMPDRDWIRDFNAALKQ